MKWLDKATTERWTKHMWHSPQEDKTSSYRMNDIKILSKRLGLLKITNKVLERTNK